MPELTMLADSPVVDLSALGRAPIAGGQPSGADIRSDPVFEQIKAQIDKLSSTSSPGSVNWEQVIQLSSGILAGRSKDLLVASYLAVALAHARKDEGLVTGLAVYADLLESYWDSLYPPLSRMQGRRAAIAWWQERTEAVLQSRSETPAPPEMIRSLGEALERIDRFLGEHLEEAPPLSPLRALVNALPVAGKAGAGGGDAAAAGAGKTGTLAAPVSQPASPATAAAGGPVEISSPTDARRVLTQGFQKVREAAAFLLQENLAQPQAYRWARTASWSQIEALPAAEQGRTRLLPPPNEVRDALGNLAAKGLHESVITAAEARFSQFMLWLDLNRFVADALSGLGQTFEQAREAVSDETAFLLRRFPGLEELSFSDGTPFADARTREWLAGISLARDAGTSSPRVEAAVAPPGDAADDEIARELEKSSALLRQGGLLQVVEDFQRHMAGSPSHKERLLWRLALSQLLVGADQAGHARPCLEGVLEDIDRHRLEEYDPALALKAFKLCWRVWRTQTDPVSQGRAAEMLNRIARLDLTEVIRMGNGLSTSGRKEALHGQRSVGRP